MMRKSKKGVTLVELVICCAIIVMLGGACTAVLASGATIFNQSSSTANAQLDAEVLQNFMIDLIPSTHEIEQTDLNTAKNSTTGTYLYFEDDVFTIQIDGKKTTIRSVTEFEYDIIRAGDPASETARAQLKYTARMADGNELEGGYVLSNVKYSSISVSADAEQRKVSVNPLYLGDN